MLVVVGVSVVEMRITCSFPWKQGRQVGSLTPSLPPRVVARSQEPKIAAHSNGQPARMVYTVYTLLTVAMKMLSQ